jgi:hypothetical protein
VKKHSSPSSLEFHRESGASEAFMKIVEHGGYMACGGSGGEFFTDACNNEKTKDIN